MASEADKAEGIHCRLLVFLMFLKGLHWNLFKVFITFILNHYNICRTFPHSLISTSQFCTGKCWLANSYLKCLFCNSTNMTSCLCWAKATRKMLMKKQSKMIIFKLHNLNGKARRKCWIENSNKYCLSKGKHFYLLNRKWTFCHFASEEQYVCISDRSSKSRVKGMKSNFIVLQVSCEIYSWS